MGGEWSGVRVVAWSEPGCSHEGEHRTGRVSLSCNRPVREGTGSRISWFVLRDFKIFIFTDLADRIVGSIVDLMVTEESTTIVEKFLPTLKAYEQRKYMDAIISFAAHRYSGPLESKDGIIIGTSPTISAVGKLIHNIIKNNETLRDHVVTILTKSNISALDDSFATRRSVVAAIAQDDGKPARIWS